MTLTDDPKKTLYDAFAAYSGAHGGMHSSSEAVSALDCMFDAIVGSMTGDARDQFVSSLRSGSTAIASIDGLLHQEMVAAQRATVKAVKEEKVMEQSVIESEVIKLLQQLPREKRTTSEDDQRNTAEVKVTASANSSSSRKETSVSADNETLKVGGKGNGVNCDLGDFSKNEFYAAQALLQSHRGGVRKRARQYSDPVPSEHCHVCCRPTRKLRFAVCSNIKRSLCRKVVCVKCFESFEWDWVHASESDTTWICTHCRDECPKRAQCYVYERINSRRKRKNKEDAMTNGAPKSTLDGPDRKRTNGALAPPSMATGNAKQVARAEVRSDVRLVEKESRD